MKVIIPIVGNDSLENNTDYMLSLYEIERKTIFQYCYDFLKPIKDAEFIVVLRKADVKRYHFDQIVKLLIPDAKIVIAEGNTKGSVCSCLLAIDYIKDDEPLVISSSNQLFLANTNEVVNEFIEKDYDGGIVTFEDIHPKFSFVKLDKEGLVIEAAEKRPISKHATAGFYYFKKGSDFIESAISMLSKDASVNGLFYLCPVYNEMILKQKRIGVYPIEREDYFLLKTEGGIEAYKQYLKEQRGKKND
ncbi:glycosyltransferase family 2 protein [Clostridium sp. M62/1]|uniref:glycosyltransferase family 2 protein n=1 Tax=Clostridium sp. M62/1 TaxID=411486 RepID=UPI0001973751|nr:glycosyltransferase family 2 protein [Clostridium sp. M62/1]EFE14039.1 hypothetical protein CLOM621_05615 [Clostridium sp. M62/1]UEB80299.1 glycosyltransferase family 2 protein [Clostridium sp. M62/1]